jgi:SNF2 family DNA or RNA helicase
LVTPGIDLPSAKREALLELVEELRENRHRALVFSQFVGHLALVRAALDERGIAYQYLDGGTPAREREKRVAAFQAGEGELFLISLKAGGTGLNLTAADYVIHLDPWWNPAVEDQASDRAHRIGQQRPVTIYRLIVADSIEEGILALHRKKRDLADALLEGADASATLSMDDLLGLIHG